MTKIDDCTLVLFGASGNLSRIKLIPGLFRLDSLGRLPEKMKILSVGRSEVEESAWRDDIKSMLDIKFKKIMMQKYLIVLLLEIFITRIRLMILMLLNDSVKDSPTYQLFHKI